MDYSSYDRSGPMAGNPLPSSSISFGMTLVFLAVFIAIVAWIFKTGYRLKS